MPEQISITRPALLLLTVATMLYGAGRPYEAYMVTAEETELYQGNQRVDFRLYRGDVVTAQPIELYKDWLNIRLDGSVYQGKADNFGRLRDLRIEYARQTAVFRTEIDEIERQIRSLIRRIEELYAAETAIAFDSMIRYQYRRLVPVHPQPQGTDAGGQDIAGGQQQSPPAVKVIYDYVDKISPGAARNQARRWEREREDIEDDLDDLQEERREALLKLNRADAQLAYVRWRFEAHQLDQGILRAQPYVCIHDRTPLFVQQNLVLELDEDVVVMAALNRENDRWLNVRLRGKIYNARRKHFLSLLGVESVLGKRVVQLEERIEETEEDNEMLRDREGLLKSAVLAADYRSRLTYISVTAHPFIGGYPGSRYYTPPGPPSDAREVFLRGRALSFIRDWEDELETVEEDIEENQDDLLEWRQELAGLKPRLEDLRSRLLSIR